MKNTDLKNSEAMEKEYSNKELEELAKNSCIWVRDMSYYSKLKIKILKAGNIPYPQRNSDHKDYPCDDLVHEQLWFDVCDIVNELAQLVLDEREKRAKFINILESTLADLNPKRFDEDF